MIYLFNKDKELINIIGEDEVQSALYDREINNVYQLDVDLPLYFWDKDVKVNLREIFNDVEFIGHYDLNEKFQLHKIAQFDILDEVIAVKGVHFFFDEAKAKHIIRDRRFANATAQAGAQAIADQLGWRLVYQATDTITSNYNFYNISPLEALNIIIDRFNIEIDFSFDFDGVQILNKKLIVKSKLGEVKDTTFYYSKEFHAGYNALSVKYEQDYSEIYTAVIPRGKGEEVGDGYGRRLEIDEVVWSKPNDPLDKPLGEVMLVDPEATQRFGYAEEGVIKPRVKVVNFNETEDGEILIQQGYEWLSENNRPKIVLSTTVDDSEEVNFGDTIWVIYEEIDLKEQFRVARVIDNLITGDRQIEIGDLDYFRSSLSEKSTNNRIDDLESQTEQFPDVIKYVVSANGYNRSFWGSIEPQNVIEGDVWFKPDETSDGDTIMLVWDGERWVETARTKDDGRIRDLLDKYEDLADEIGKDIELNIDQIIDVLDGANQVDLAHIFARLIGDDRFSTLFYQEAENVGFVYREGDEVKSIIAIQSGVPFIRGEHIILDGNTIVDGDFTVTEQMLADEAVFNKLETHGIDAAEIRVINLDASNISGGNLELANGLKITNNGAVVMEVTSDGTFLFDATAAGVATKQELENIELTPGPKGDKGEKGDKGATGSQGIQGPKGNDGVSQYVHIRYSANSNGSGMTTMPLSNTKYIGLANTNSSTAPSGYSSYTWSKYRGEDGNQGIQGPPGADGEPTYTWVKYADTPTSGISDSPDGKKYIGLAFNKSTPNESNSYSQYTWSLMPQNIALGVRNLVPWTNFTDYRDNISKWSTWGSTFIWRASQIGKYMLFRNNNTDRTGTTNIGVISPPFYKNVEAGKTYTVRFLGNPTTPYTPFGYSYLMNVDGVEKVDGTGTGNQSLPFPTVTEDYERFTATGYANLYEITFSPTWNGPAAIMLASTIDASAQSSHYISEVMLVEGDSISRDWQPAPEDVEQLMHNSVDGKVDEINAELSEHWEAIGDKISTTAFTDALNSMKADYEDGLIEASKVPERVETLLSRNEAMISRLGEDIAKWEFLDTHVRLGNEGLYIGDVEGDSAVLVGKDRISFMQGQNEIAYISGQQMYINRSINVESMQVGSHVQMKIDNNNTVIQWVGG